LATRSEFYSKFIHHKALVENLHNSPIKNFYSDNGGEYISDQFKKYCEETGIVRATTIPYTPEQNGMAEVRFRILFSKARAMLIDASLPKHYGLLQWRLQFTYIIELFLKLLAALRLNHGMNTNQTCPIFVGLDAYVMLWYPPQWILPLVVRRKERDLMCDQSVVYSLDMSLTKKAGKF
jgi:hypothetical protein